MIFKYGNSPGSGRGFNFCALVIICSLIQCVEKKPIDNMLKPNIILIMTDDQGWGDLSSNGNKMLSTPNLDRLRAEGVSFRNFFVSPVCAPTRASLLTGRYALRTGTTWVTHRKEVMKSEELTLAELLRQHDYKTGIFGKWHNGLQYPNDPLGQGFDEFFGFSAGHWNNYFNTILQHNQEKVETSGYIADVLTDKALQFIERNRDNSFFCYLPYNTPHGPFQVPDRLFDKYKGMGLNNKDAAVYGMCENIDDNVNRLLNKLDELGLDGHTIVFFLTDNGPNGHRYNGGMKGIKASVDEGGVKVPMFVRWKGRLSPGREISAISAHIDILPTIAGLCQINLPQDLKLDGKNLVPLLEGEENNWPERNIFNYKPRRKPERAGAVRNNTYRLVIDADDNLFLYDMSKDPGQKNNVAEAIPQVAQDLKRAFNDWFDDVTADGIAPPPVPVGFEAAPMTALPAPEANLHGNLKFKGKMGWANDWIINWKGPADTAIWLLDVKKEGLYEVIAEINADDKMVGATLTVSSGMIAVGHEIEEPFFPDDMPAADRIERGEVYERPWKSIVIGKLKLEKGAQNISVRVNSLHGDGQLSLKTLWLKKQINGLKAM